MVQLVKQTVTHFLRHEAYTLFVCKTTPKKSIEAALSRPFSRQPVTHRPRRQRTRVVQYSRDGTCSRARSQVQLSRKLLMRCD